jgi:hypothetical protein
VATEGGRLRLLAAIVLLITGNTIRHMFSGTKPFDWLMLVVEVLVLLLIAYEVFVGVYRHRRKRERKQHIGEITAALSGFMDKGKALQGSVPCQEIAWELQADLWMANTDRWATETGAFLDGHSSTASAAFRLTPGTGTTALVIQNSEGATFTIDGRHRHAYQRLVSRLENLRGIIEKPEVYF